MGVNHLLAAVLIAYLNWCGTARALYSPGPADPMAAADPEPAAISAAAAGLSAINPSAQFVNGLCGGACPQGPKYPSKSCPDVAGTPFAASDYNTSPRFGACLANVWEDCRVGGPNAWDDKNFCGACDLYINYCYPKTNSSNLFVASRKIAPGADTLLLPVQPCKGVDQWTDNQCQGEAIWSFGADRISADVGPNTTFTYGMAINPISRRSRHQMHVHVGELLTSLTAALIKGRQALGPQLENGTRFDVNCTKGQNNCRFGSVNGTEGDLIVRVVYLNMKNFDSQPSLMRPFRRVYGTPDAPVGLASNRPRAARLPMKYVTAGVVKMGIKEWGLMTWDANAECYFSSTIQKCG